jgi:hypothetical protein
LPPKKKNYWGLSGDNQLKPLAPCMDYDAQKGLMSPKKKYYCVESDQAT